MMSRKAMCRAILDWSSRYDLSTLDALSDGRITEIYNHYREGEIERRYKYIAEPPGHDSPAWLCEE